MRTVQLHGEQAPSATFVKSSLIDATHYVASQFNIAYTDLLSVAWSDSLRLTLDQSPAGTFVKTQIQ